MDRVPYRAPDPVHRMDMPIVLRGVTPNFRKPRQTASPETSESRYVQEPTPATSGQMRARGCGRGLEMMLEMDWDHAVKHTCGV